MNNIYAPPALEEELSGIDLEQLDFSDPGAFLRNGRSRVELNLPDSKTSSDSEGEEGDPDSKLGLGEVANISPEELSNWWDDLPDNPNESTDNWMENFVKAFHVEEESSVDAEIKEESPGNAEIKEAPSSDDEIKEESSSDDEIEEASSAIYQHSDAQVGSDESECELIGD